MISWENIFESVFLEQTNLKFLRDSYLYKTKDTFVTPEDNQHKLHIFEISIKKEIKLSFKNTWEI